MSKTVTAKPLVTVEMAVEVLRKLSPRERLKLIATVLPETERELPKSQPIQRKSLRGFWKDLNVHLTAEDIDQARREMWTNFPNVETIW